MPDLIQLAKSTAISHNLDPKVVCAVCEQESGWDPWALRFEPAFYQRYIVPLGLKSPTEAQARAFSFGLMQVMGQVAREMGCTSKYLTELCDPVVGIEFGCRVLNHKLALAHDDLTKGLLLYNGGGNPDYPTQVLARVSKY